MNTLNFIQSGGFPMDVNVLDQMQTACKIFNGLGQLAGDLSIIKGCNVIGETITDGIVYINGELLEFRSGAVQDRVIIIQEAQSKEFENGSIKEVHYTRYATFGTAETSWPWADFVRPMETKAMVAALQLKADKTIVDGILDRLATAEAKLATIAKGAEVNVQADMSETNVDSDAYIKNKPETPQPYLCKGVYYVGDVAAHGPDTTVTISIPDVGTSYYVVVGSLVSKGNVLTDNDVWWITKNTSSTSFQLSLREASPGAQSLEFRYALISL